MHRVLVLGGYGVFGRLISERLSANKAIDVVIAGRHKHQAEALARTLSAKHGGRVSAAKIDLDSDDFDDDLEDLAPHTVIHAAGPFQKRNYDVAKECIKLGANYIDLADSRDYVSGISVLDHASRDRGVLVASGASTVPALSAAVLRHYEHEFQEIHTLNYAVSPGNRCPRGLATVRSILSYCGKPIPRWENGRMGSVIGWRDAQRCVVQGLSGARLVAACDIPDTAIFPRYFPTLRDIRFYAGLETPPLVWGLLAAAYLPAPGGSWANAAKPLLSLSNLFLNWGTDEGGMVMSLSGVGRDGRPHTVNWSLYAGTAHGPHIPATPAVVLAEKLAAGGVMTAGGAGARPCVDMLSYEEMMRSLAAYDVVAYGHGAPAFPGLRQPSQAANESGTRVYACEAALSRDNLQLLPKFMRDFHTSGGLVRGQLTVSQGDTLLARLLARIGGLPRAMANVPVVVHSGDERWTRFFGEKAVAAWDNYLKSRRATDKQTALSSLHPPVHASGVPRGDIMQSRWLAEGGLAVEAFGIFKFYFQLKPLQTAAGVGFSHVCKRMTVLGVPVPRWLMLRPDGVTLPVRGQTPGWHVDVDVRAPLVGRLVRYVGQVYRAEQ